MSKRAVDLTGQSFGRLVVEQRTGTRGCDPVWACKCSCGATVTVRSNHLVKGRTRSCGCLNIEMLRARAKPNRRPPEYGSWLEMRRRCRYSKRKDFHRYGGRGISVCERWDSFESFLADMGPRPSPKHSIDRIENDGNYEPGNCRWASKKEQAANTRAVRVLVFGGEGLPLPEWADRVGISRARIAQRLAAGWSVERALTTPTRDLMVARHG